ncbi:MAG: amidohydrolase family protein, partial [Pseudomonas marincola]
GALNFSPADLQAMISDYHAKRYQIAAHVQGERAARSVIDAISKAQKDNPNPSLRHRLEHNALITDELLTRAKDLNISVGFFVDHLTYYGDTLPKIFGDDRMARYMPVKSAFDKGLIVTLHGDHPSTPIDPFLTLQTATTRLSRSGQTISGENEKISIYQALQAMTINAATQLGQDAEIGSIEVGKRADFTFLSSNPLTMAPGTLHTIEAMETWKDGQPVDTGLVKWQNIKLGFNTLVEILSR